MPPGALSAIFDQQTEHRRKWKKPPIETVDEMPDAVKFGYAMPTILNEILKKMEEGMPLEEVDRRKLLDLAEWSYVL